MSSGNLVSAALKSADQTAIIDALQTIRTKLPFLIPLTADDRRRLLKMGDGSRAFVEGALNGVRNNPRIFPASFDSAEFDADWALREALLPIIAQVEQLAELLDDTQMALGSDLMSAATAAYGYLQAEGASGNDSLRAALSARFKRGSRPSTPAVAPVPASA